MSGSDNESTAGIVCPFCLGPVARGPRSIYCSEGCQRKANLARRYAAERAEISKAKRLAIGGSAAPVVRRAALRPRKITTVDADGAVKRVLSNVDVVTGILTRIGVEFSVTPGKRPSRVVCEGCGEPISVRKKGIPPSRCGQCRLGTCAECGDPVGSATVSRARKRGTVARCRKCFMRAMQQTSSMKGVAARQRISKERILAESVCRLCSVALPVPTTAKAAAKLRHKCPKGRVCGDCSPGVD